MLRHLLARALFLAPTLLVLVVLAFALVDSPADPATDAAVLARVGEARALSLRDERGFGLPRFLERDPKDVAARARAALARLLDDAGDRRGGEALVRLGGAALPFVLPRLDDLSPAARERVAVALRPLAARMRLDVAANEATPPADAARAWVRFWDERAGDFRPATTARALRRFFEHGSAMREADLVARDTYALDEAMDLVARASIDHEADAVARVLAFVAHAAASEDAPRAGASRDEIAACRLRWQAWWIAHRSELTVHDPVARLAAVVLDTRFGRWLEPAVRLRLGLAADGTPVLARLADDARPTLAIAALASLLAALLALPLGMLAARLAGGTTGLAVRGAIGIAEAAPTAAVAVLLAPLGAHVPRVALGAAALALALVASPARQHRAALLEAASSDWARTARAMGASRGWVLARWATRAALTPTLALLTVELPETLTGAFVAERALSLPGLGAATLTAVRTHDVAFLMALAVGATVVSFVVLLAGDFLLVVLDPRARRGASERTWATP